MFNSFAKKLHHAASNNRKAAWVLGALLAVAIGVGCDRSDDGQGKKLAAEPDTKAIQLGELTNLVQAVSGRQLATLTNQLAQEYASELTNRLTLAERAHQEATQKLLSRIEQMERRDAEQRAAVLAVQKARDAQTKEHEERVGKLVRQLSELEGKVGSLHAGRVLPEIVIAPDDSPTTRELDQKIRIAVRQQELAAEAAADRAKERPSLSVGEAGFRLNSAETNFVLRIRGLLQWDTRTFLNDNPYEEGNDGFVLRRLRPIVEGTVFRDFDFQFTPDFSTPQGVQVFDAWVNYRLQPELQLRVGKFRGPVGLENAQPVANTLFNERSLVSNLVARRSVGVQLWGEVGDGLLGYAVGAFNGGGDSRNPGASDFGDDREFAGRLSTQPFRKFDLPVLHGLTLGVAASHTHVSSNSVALPATLGGTLPGYTTPALQQFFAYNPLVGPVVAHGTHWRFSPSFTYLNGPFGLMGEYAVSGQDVLNATTLAEASLEHRAWQLSGQWVLTGEPASFNGIVPKRPFDWNAGGWGAWQLVARYSEMSIDDAAFQGFADPATSARGAAAWSVGVNWWLNRNVRLLSSFSHTVFDGGGGFNPLLPGSFTPPATVTRQDERVFLTRLQLAF